jgi:hypothetical protein
LFVLISLIHEGSVFIELPDYMVVWNQHKVIVPQLIQSTPVLPFTIALNQDDVLSLLNQVCFKVPAHCPSMHGHSTT